MMTGRTVVITGATSGIGQAGAEELARMGARIVQIARDPARGEPAMNRLKEIASGVSHAIYYADLTSIADTKRVGEDIAAAEPRVHVLINNAGAIFSRRQLTDEGLERTFALNHMSYFILSHYLTERLEESATARVINTSSDAHESGTIDFDDLQSERAYQSTLVEYLRFGGGAVKVYGRSKLCNILFTRELARRLRGSGVTANAFHPGFVSTRFADQAGGLISFGTKIAKRFARSVAKGAETMVFLASSPEVSNVTGEYFFDCRPIATSSAAADDAAARRLWDESMRLAGL